MKIDEIAASQPASIESSSLRRSAAEAAACKSAALVQPLLHSPRRVEIHCSSASLLYRSVYNSSCTLLFFKTAIRDFSHVC